MKQNISIAITNRHNLKYAWILFFILPVVSCVFAIRNFKNKSLRVFIILFGALYGLTFIPIPGSDATRYAATVENSEDYDFNSYWLDIENVISGRSEFPDIYAYTMFYISTSITNSPNFFFMLVGLIYFLVYVKLIGRIYDLDYNILKKSYVWFFLGIVFILNFSSGVNGVRWPLGLMVFSFGALNLLAQNKIKYLIIAALSTLIHFSFIGAVASLLAFYYIPLFRKTNVLLIFAAFALIAGTVFSTLIFSNAGFLGEVIQDKLSDYTGEGYVDGRAKNISNWNFYVPIANFGTYFFSIGVLFVMWFKQKKMNRNQVTKQLYGFAILMSAISFIANAIVDLSTNRYTLIVSFLTLVFLFYMGLINKNSKTLKYLAYIYAPIIILKALLVIRVDWETVSLALLTNPIFLLLFQ
jgi:hypothetical protein